MIPPKNSAYRSWESLVSFMGDTDKRQMESRSSLIKANNHIMLAYADHSLLSFHEDEIHIFRPTFKNKNKWIDLANPILSEFGWYYGDITFGPHKKYWRGLKPTNVTPGSPESNYRSLAPINPRQAIMYTLDWKGKVTSHGGKLTEYQVKKCLKSYETRATASRAVRSCAYVLGFPNTAKMDGFRLPKDKSIENANRMNALARGYGFAHVAHAWANGFLIPTDETEIEMLESGMVHLVKDSTNPLDLTHSLYEQSSKLWLRQRSLEGEDLVTLHT